MSEPIKKLNQKLYVLGVVLQGMSYHVTRAVWIGLITATLAMVRLVYTTTFFGCFLLLTKSELFCYTICARSSDKVLRL